MKKAVKEKLEKVVELVGNVLADPDLDIDYCIPGVETTSGSCDTGGTPYILVKFADAKYVERRINLSDKYMQYPSEDLANLVTFYIEQFMEEIESLQYGAQ